MYEEKPHILIITLDELSKEALSCYGGEAVKTENIDRLADKSFQFNKAYAPSPLCLPSRCSIATGLYPHRSGCYSNSPNRQVSLSPEKPNIYNFLKTQGYTTAHIGKCHYAPVPYGQIRPDVTLPYDDFRKYYVSLGIDHLDLQDDKQVSVWFYDDYSKELDKAGYLKAYRDATWDRGKQKVFAFPGPSEWHPDSWVGRKAMEYLKSYNSDKPLFLWLSFSGPHYPFDPPKEYLGQVDINKVGIGRYMDGEFDDPRKIHHQSYHGKGGIDGCGPAIEHGCKNYTDEYWKRLRHHYFANVVQIDDEIGKILKMVNERLGDNALVIFTCDHGEMLGNHRLWGKEKCGYEDVLNVPLLVNMPGQQDSKVSDALVSLIDIMPTCFAAIGVEGLKMDGRDLLKSFEDGGYRYIFAESENFIVVTDGFYKYIHLRRDNTVQTELYDLKKDPYEYNNQVYNPDYKDILENLRNAVLDLFLESFLP